MQPAKQPTFQCVSLSKKEKVLTPLMIPVDSAAESADTTAEQSRARGSAESTLEFFVDGPETEVPRINRSPSPIRYARPPSGVAPGNWQAHVLTKGETTDDDLAGASSSASNSPNLAPFKRKRVQLRSYKMDYRPQMQNVTDLPDILVNDSSSRENLLLISTSAAATTMGTVVPSPSRLARRALPHPPKSKRAKMKKKDKCLVTFPRLLPRVLLRTLERGILFQNGKEGQGNPEDLPRPCHWQY